MNKELKKSIEQAQIKWLQQQLEEKDKIIELMAEDFAEICESKVSKEAIIDFYFKKVMEKKYD